jgi:hypothetical protein
MSLDQAKLFALLPAVYRTADATAGNPLEALVAVLAAQSAIVEDNIEQLYDDQFIETCAPWVIPYIGDLIGYNSIYEIASASFDSRAEVANTIGYRRRKGTLIALEQMCADVSGRPAAAVEQFKRLIITESMRHVRPRHGATVNLRNISALDRLDTAFDVENHTVDVRRIAPRVRVASDPDSAPLDIALHGPGRFNIPDVAIYLWRWKSWPVVKAPAFRVRDGAYMFSPLGQDMPLFSQPVLRSSFASLAGRMNVPQPIRRHEFAISLSPKNDASANPLSFYGPSSSILLTADGFEIPASQIVCANLSERPGCAPCQVKPGLVAIDPELGRIQFAADVHVPQTLLVNYSYGFPAEIGGGPYDRSLSLTQINPSQTGFVALVGSANFPTLESAIQQWNLQPAGMSGLIVLPSYANYAIDLTGGNAIQLPPQSNLSIVSAEPLPKGGPLDFVWSDSRVTLFGNLDVVGLPAAAAAPPDGETPPAGQLFVSGVWIAGQILVTGDSVSLQLADATLVPGLGFTRCGQPRCPGDASIVMNGAESSLSLTRCISGPIAAGVAGTARICSSIVDASSPCGVAYAGADLASVGADLHVEDSTIIGKVRTRTLPLASNTIFHARRSQHDGWLAAVWCSRKQTGCVRFCSLPFDSVTPSRYRCLPTAAASESALAPKFVTLSYGHPSYALLSGDVPMAVWTGADNGSQIGVYYQIEETEAVRNVQVRAPEYLPFGLEAGIFLEPSRPALAAPLPFGYGSGRCGGVESCDGDEPGELERLGFGAHLI